eukprot:Colp12_sorted_trinity150504_noHs@11783
MRVVTFLTCAVALLVVSANAVSFKLNVGTTKCIKEDVSKDVLVVGEYAVSNQVGGQQVVNLVISDGRGKKVDNKKKLTNGRFAFTADEYDTYEICFENSAQDGQPRSGDSVDVKLKLKSGVEAKDYEEVAKAEKLKPMEMELRRLEDLAESIVNDMFHMKKREEEMRDTNESTNARVVWFSIFSIVCLVSLGGWQVYYLKKFFQQRRLID